MRRSIVAVLVLAACTSAADNNARDLAEFTVRATPSLEISGNDAAGDPRIGLAEGVTRLASGELIIADRGLSSLRYFSADGELLRSVGRAGDGPGEFRYIASMQRCGDSLWVHDIARSEPYQVFDLEGNLGRTVTFENVGSQQPYRSACNANGQFLHMGWENMRLTPGRVRGQTPFWIAESTGQLRVALGEFPGSERLVIAGGSSPHPLGREPVLAMSRGRAYIGSADSFAILSFAIDGSPGTLLRYLEADVRTTADDIERFKFLDTVGQNRTLVQAFVRMWEGVEFPPTVPPYDQMLVDTREQLWVRRTPRRIGGEAEWIVFDTDGTPLARASMSGDFRVHEIGDDYILGIAVDPADGTQSIRLFSLSRNL